MTKLLYQCLQASGNVVVLKLSALLFLLFNFNNIAYAQTTSNQSAVTNSAAPSASSVTNGGTNINYQTNNAYNNDFGFGGGVSCRTPTLYVGGNTGNSRSDQTDPLQTIKNSSNSVQFNAGILFPFGSPVIDNCKDISSTISKDRAIASELSLIKACHDLYEKDIVVNPESFPLLQRCASYSIDAKNTASLIPNQNTNKAPITKPELIPVTDRAL